MTCLSKHLMAVLPSVPRVCSFNYQLMVIRLLLSDLYLLYAKLEEDYGLARHAMAVYDRATTAVLPEEQNEACHMIVTCSLVAFVFSFEDV